MKTLLVLLTCFVLPASSFADDVQYSLTRVIGFDGFEYPSSFIAGYATVGDSGVYTPATYFDIGVEACSGNNSLWIECEDRGLSFYAIGDVEAWANLGRIYYLDDDSSLTVLRRERIETNPFDPSLIVMQGGAVFIFTADE